MPVDKLSGGNQQKVIMARWINKQPNLFILDEPTRGVDVNAKNAIHKLIKEFSEQGGSVILISSEIEEILNLSDRVLIVKDGTFVSEVAKRQMTKQVLMEQSLC
ncbi:ATP-binding cassette domain-containing protein [Intestinimonas massiliensis]|uniref:ATP-binding cassette domain-containing protein n=1 Tax=Intestinimonas massiliensis (ex Afouda et al. 2020) TaxID=1673721 RepID=A0AAW5JX44_9FIRM|nr:ATP-binding cassette domain-containing protein [Intestinimonas massiliensis (ex Afouda et al. 2020)]MCQ4771859.1 ATP-binding cassette domain-containing protein [Intestinimonas massiliensis (ex Afouda et al. 2020)]